MARMWFRVSPSGRPTPGAHYSLPPQVEDRQNDNGVSSGAPSDRGYLCSVNYQGHMPSQPQGGNGVVIQRSPVGSCPHVKRVEDLPASLHKRYWSHSGTEFLVRVIDTVSGMKYWQQH